MGYFLLKLFYPLSTGQVGYEPRHRGNVILKPKETAAKFKQSKFDYIAAMIAKLFRAELLDVFELSTGFKEL